MNPSHLQEAMNNPAILLPQRPIAFNREFVELGIGITGALLLSQALYWDRNESSRNREGWFYKTTAEWEEETGMTKEEIQTAQKRLISKGYLVKELRGVPARNWFLVQKNELACDLIKIQSEAEWATNKKQVGGNGSNQLEGIPSTSRRESRQHSIQRIQTESTNTKKESAPSFKPEGASIIKAFESLDPKNKSYYGRRDMRAACDFLIEEYSLEVVISAIEFIKNGRGKIKYLPVITDPKELRDKWGKLAFVLEKKTMEHEETNADALLMLGR